MPQPALQDRYDVIVIGGGPAGATTGALTAEHGHSTLVLERSDFPRFHVGESLIPETYWTLKRLGLLEQMRASAYPKKYSVQFFSEGTKPSAPFYFDEYKDCESSQTWQVWRDSFDRMLLDNVAAKGGTVHTEAHVIDVLFDGDQAVGVKVRLTSNGERVDREIACSVVVDATGQSAFLATRLGVKDSDPCLRMGTIWNYFKNARRDAGRDEGATLIMQTPEKKSWFWFIPLPDNVASVGVTGNMEYMFSKGASPTETFQRELDRCPAMAERLVDATQERDLLTTKDYSYHAKQAVGPGWVLVGDSFGFIDPVYSTGVFLALKSGELAAHAIHEALTVGDLTAESLGGWQSAYRDAVNLFRKLVYAFYAPDFSFGKFLKAHPQYRANVTDMLIGDVFKPGVGEIFDAMGDALPASDWTLATTTNIENTDLR
jgi:flavin-dependent dehydrogenase